jgi:light-regulated signal transduction histidine kinase (bacteriophytochrome)
VLLALRDDRTRRIVQVSANIEALVGLPVDRVLGAPIAELFAARDRGTIEAALGVAATIRIRAEPLRLSGRMWDVIVHRAAGLFVVELEPTTDAAGTELTAVHAALHELTTRTLAARTPAALHELLPEPLRRLTGYERVMIYLFDDTGDGEVVAEARAPGVESYLGLHYPASDIPPQARRLYAIEPTRIIVDARYQPVPLVPSVLPDGGDPLDLSRSVLRSVSPVHCRYLANMGVRGSMSISLVDGDRLFGLIACHHRGPHHVNYPLREACGWLGRVASFVHVSRQREANLLAVERAGRTMHRLVQQMEPNGNIAHGLVGPSVTVLDLIDATGAVIRFEGKTYLVGRTPPRSFVDGLVTWIDSAMRDGLYVSNRLPADHRAAAEHLDLACGVLAISLGGKGDVLAWLRPELRRTVNWAGEPDRPAELDDSGDIGPRRSFALWQEQIREQAAPFEPWHREVAANFRRLLAGVVLRRTAELTRLNRELRAALHARDEFLSVASHELKTPLSTLLLSLEILESIALGDEPLDQARMMQRLNAARRQVVRLDRLVSTLLDVSRIHAGRLDLDVHDDDLAAAVRDVADRMATSGASITVHAGSTVRCRFDRLRIDQVVTNLIANAIKYGGDRPIDVGVSARDGRVRLIVRDHGPGIPRELRERLFERFERAPDASGVEGFGLGLWIARAIVRAHGGEIHIEDTPGGGATVVVELPRRGPGTSGDEGRQ